MKFSAEDVAAAVAAATANHQAALTAAREEATQAERARITGVLATPAAKGREKQALAVALVGATPQAAEAMLAAAQFDAKPEFQSRGLRSKDAPGGLVIDASGDKGPAPAAGADWSATIEKANAAIDSRVVK